MSQNNKVRVAVIGAGHLGRIHTRLIKGIDSFDLIAVADPIAAARDTVEKDLSVKTVDDYRQLLGQIDAAVICSPTIHHLEIALWCLENNVHCFVEKPLVRSTRHADLLINTAQRRKKTLQVGHVERFNPVWQTAKPLLKNPVFIQGHRTSTYTGRSTDIGVVFDLMIHDIDLLLNCVDSKIKNVVATGQAVLGETEDWAEARIEFENGTHAHLSASRVSPHASRKMQVRCDAGFFTLDFATGKCDAIEFCEDVANQTVRADRLPESERKSIQQDLFTKWLPQRTIESTPCNAIEAELIDFHHAIATDELPCVTGQDARDAVALAERILDSISQSSEIRLKSRALDEIPSIIPAAHRFGVRRAS